MSEHPVSTSQSVPRTSDSQWRSYLAYAAWIQALIATGGSLYFSGAMGYIPCTLCWYQRTMMYPLALIIAAGIWLRESRLRVYVLPLCLIGWLVAFYHVLLQYGIISEELSPCVAGVSCTTEWINWFGFITIPLLSFTAFSVITFCMVFYQREEEINDHEDKKKSSTGLNLVLIGTGAVVIFTILFVIGRLSQNAQVVNFDASSLVYEDSPTLVPQIAECEG